MNADTDSFEELSPKDISILLKALNVTTHIAKSKAVSINEIAYHNAFVLIYPHQLSIPQRIALAQLIDSLPEKLVIFGGPQNPPPHN